MEALLVPIIVALLGGGALTALVTYLNAKRRAPAEIDSIVVQGAEAAVLSLQRAVDAANARANDVAVERDRLAAEIARKDQRIMALETQLDRLQKMLNDARDEIAAIRRGD